jgi:phage-related protein
MTTLAFTYAPSYSAVESSKPATRIVRFSDGYEQRLSFGLKTDFKTWQLRFDNRSDDEAEQIKGFLEARRGVDAFTWTNPYGGAAFYVCEEWSVEHAGCNLNNIQATFREVIAI